MKQRHRRRQRATRGSVWAIKARLIKARLGVVDRWAPRGGWTKLWFDEADGLKAEEWQPMLERWEPRPTKPCPHCGVNTLVFGCFCEAVRMPPSPGDTVPACNPGSAPSSRT